MGFFNCGLLKTGEDGSREATSKAQAIAATHALHALSIPKEKEGGVKYAVGGVESWREVSDLTVHL